MSTSDVAVPTTPASELDALRVDIDRIDAAMHELLIERGSIIDRLIAIKARQGGGSAFRPGREAEMMRRLAERHRGHLPLDTVESIWRVIISTFTFLQANYAVHADMAGGDAAMRDCARFHFGWTVPLRSHFGAKGVIAAVGEATGDLGLVPVDGLAARGPWWRALTAPDAPKIIARLPFIERPDHPAGLPVFVLARPFAAAAVRDVMLYSLEFEQGVQNAAAALSRLGCTIVAQADASDTSVLLIESADLDADAVAGAFGCRRETVRLDPIGSHATRFAFA